MRLVLFLFPMFLSPLCALAQTPPAWPVTVTHRFGTTEIAQAPMRVVSVGYHEQDFLYALGLAPVGVHEWFGGQPHATWPWAEAARRDLGAEPEVQRGFEIDLEWVHAQRPDLIVATFAPMDAQTYAMLSRIAPVVGPPADYPDWQAPWQDELRLIGQATGRGDRAEAVIAEVEAGIAAQRAAYPQMQGAEAALVYLSGTELIGYGPQDGGNRMLAALGLTIPAAFGELVTQAGNFPVSLERLDLFDRDVTVWLSEGDGRQMIEGLPAFRASRMAREKRAVWTDPEEMAALSFQSPLSIPWVLERLVPRIGAALAPAR